MRLKKNKRPSTKPGRLFATYFLQQVWGEQCEPHLVQFTQQVPHLPPEQQLSAAWAVAPMKDRPAARAERAMNLRMMN